jgi:alkylation response protein AidB-like acyl-CoA dehydrogenase
MPACWCVRIAKIDTKGPSVDVALSAEQVLLVDVAGDFADRFSPADLRELPAALDGRSASPLAEAGWLDMRIGAAADAPAATCLDVALVAEQCGRALATTPFAGPLVAAELMRLAGIDAASGAPPVIALSSTLDGIASEGAGAVAFDSAGATTALFVDPDGVVHHAEVDAARRHTVDITRRCASLRPASGRATSAVLTVDAVEQLLAFGLVLVSADALGAAEAALQAAVEHARAREQFGRPIGSFQAVAHLLADAYVSVQAVRSVVWHGAWAVDALAPAEALAAARLTKAYSATAALQVAEAAVQVFGGTGMTWEAPVSARLRRVLLDRAVLGDERTHLLKRPGRR